MHTVCEIWGLLFTVGGSGVEVHGFKVVGLADFSLFDMLRP